MGGYLAPGLDAGLQRRRPQRGGGSRQHTTLNAPITLSIDARGAAPNVATDIRREVESPLAPHLSGLKTLIDMAVR